MTPAAVVCDSSAMKLLPPLATACVVLLTACGSGPPLTDQPAAPVDLSGHWCLVRAQLDEALSAAERVDEFDLDTAVHRRPDDLVKGRLNLPLQMRVERLRIDQGRGYTRLNYGDLLIREYDWGTGNNRDSVDVGWDLDALVVRTDLGNRERLVERYALARDNARLLQETRYSGRNGREQFTRVFERVGPDVTWCRLAAPH